MSPPGVKAKTTGFFRPCASWVCANPAGRLWFTVMLVVAETLNGEDDSVPVSVAVSETTVPAAAVICPVIETGDDHSRGARLGDTSRQESAAGLEERRAAPASEQRLHLLVPPVRYPDDLRESCVWHALRAGRRRPMVRDLCQ